MKEKFSIYFLISLCVCFGVLAALISRQPACIRSSIVHEIDIGGRQVFTNCRFDSRPPSLGSADLETLQKMQKAISKAEARLSQFGTFPRAVSVHILEQVIASNTDPSLEAHEVPSVSEISQSLNEDLNQKNQVDDLKQSVIFLNSGEIEGDLLEQTLLAIWFQSRFDDFSQDTHFALAHALTKKPVISSGRELQKAIQAGIGNWVHHFAREKSASANGYLSGLVQVAYESLPLRQRYVMQKHWIDFSSRGRAVHHIGQKNFESNKSKSLQSTQSALMRSVLEIESLGVRNSFFKPWSARVVQLAYAQGIFQDSQRLENKTGENALAPSFQMQTLIVLPNSKLVGSDLFQELAKKAQDITYGRIGITADEEKAYLLPSGFEIQHSELDLFRAQMGIWISCEHPELESLQRFSARFERLVILQTCSDQLQHVDWSGIFEPTLNRFLAANPTLPFVQFHLPSLSLLKTSMKAENPFQWVQKVRTTSLLQKELGWKDAIWNQSERTYKVSSAIQAIEFFRPASSIR